MSGSRVPAPDYIAEQVTGVLIDSTLYIDSHFPIDSGHSAPLTGTFTLRYAIPVLVPPGIALIPGLFVSERGQMFTGREAWDYLEKRFQLHPRADIIGVMPDGTPLQLLVKALDFGATVQAWLYHDAAIAAPVALLSAVVARNDQVAALPDLLRRYVARSALPPA